MQIDMNEKLEVMEMGMNEKIKELFRDNDIDSAFISNSEGKGDANFYYFSQLSKPFFDGDYLALHRGKGKPTVIASSLGVDVVRKSRNVYAKGFASRKAALKIIGKELKGKRIGVDCSAYPKKRFDLLRKKFRGKRFVDISDAIARLRAVKTKEELKIMRESCRIAEAIVGKAEGMIRKGISERKLFKEIQKEIIENDCIEAYSSIVAFGKGSAVPHYVPTDKKLQKGEIVLLDVGVSWKNYCSDITRCFVLGNASERQREIYERVFNAKEAAIERIREGVKVKELNKAAEKELGRRMAHGLGHGLGIEAHDFPEMFPDYKLQEGNVITVEPGIYIKGFCGIRIEDDVAVKENGFERLTKAPKKLVEL